MTGTLLGIACKPKTRAPMAELESAEINVETGIAGDWRGGMTDRQITILFEDDWDTVAKVTGGKLPWTRRRANLFVAGVKNPQGPGGIIKVGDVVLQVMEETEPCSRMDQSFPGLRTALQPNWRGGVCCNILEGGTISVGDAVSIST